MEIIRIRLDELLKENHMTRYELSKLTGIRHQTLTGYYRNIVVRYDSHILLSICNALNCNIDDLIELR